MKRLVRWGSYTPRCVCASERNQNGVVGLKQMRCSPSLGILHERRYLWGIGNWEEVGKSGVDFWGRSTVDRIGFKQMTQHGVRRKHSLTRDWFTRLWVADKKDDRLEEKRGKGGAGNWSPFYRTSIYIARFRGKMYQEAEGYVKNQSESYTHGGPFGGSSLSPSSPEETKLVPLLAKSDLLITRDIEWANLMFAFEQESRYKVVDPHQPHAPMGSIHEQSNVIYRQLLRTRRPFTAYITDAYGNEIFRIHRPFWWINSTIYAEVNGKEIGVVHRRWHLWRRIYDLYLGKKQFAVVENPGFWNWTFTLKDNDENVLAEINRDWRGFGLELFTDAGQYIIRFGAANSGSTSSHAANFPELDVVRPLTLSERAVAVALAVSLDCDYFSRHGGWGMPIFIADE